MPIWLAFEFRKTTIVFWSGGFGGGGRWEERASAYISSKRFKKMHFCLFSNLVIMSKALKISQISRTECEFFTVWGQSPCKSQNSLLLIEIYAKAEHLSVPYAAENVTFFSTGRLFPQLASHTEDFRNGIWPLNWSASVCKHYSAAPSRVQISHLLTWMTMFWLHPMHHIESACKCPFIKTKTLIMR